MTLSSQKVRIVGSGLIGTSLALALARSGHRIDLVDLHESHEKLARDLLGRAFDPEASLSPDLVVIATPIEEILPTLLVEYGRYPESRFIDIGGLKSNLLLEVARIPGLNAKFLGSHPMAGREVSGPASARADLFEGRAWVITPSSQTDNRFIAEMKELILQTGASIFEVDPESHDEQIALVSHLPQIVSSLLASQLLDHSPDELSLAGAGLRDTTRLAASSANLWSQLLSLNSREVLPILERFNQSIDKLIDHLHSANVEGVKTCLEEGNAGRALIPGKHGGKGRDYHLLPIVIEDKPGQLAKIFKECEKIDVNVEDLQIEHSPGQETGLVTLSLSESDALALHAHLISEGWLAHKPRTA